MSSIWLIILVILAGGGIGRLAHRLWRDSDAPALDRYVLDISMGMGLLSLVYFAMAACQILSGPWPLILCSVLSILGIPMIADAIRWFRTRSKGGRFITPVTVLWIIVFTGIAATMLIPALVPPTSADWDSLAYHLAVPKLYLQHGGFFYIDLASHSNFPFLVEMLYTPALSIGDAVGAKLVHYLYGVLLAFSVALLAKRHFHPKAAPLAALAIASMPLVMWEATTAYIDLATALYTVLGVYLLLEYLDKPRLHFLVGCGIAAGFAASTKLTGLALFPLLAIWLLIDRFYTNRTIQWKQSLLICGVALLVCSPWYLKTFIYTGSPVYPFFYPIFGGKDWSMSLADNYSKLQAQFGQGHDFASFIFLPYDLTFESWCFYDTPGLFPGPIFLIAVPLLLLARYRSNKLFGLAMFFMAQLVIWFCLTQQSRYLIPAFAILAVIIAAIAYTDERMKYIRAALISVFIATAVFGIVTESDMIKIAYPCVIGHQTRQQYLSQYLWIYPAQEWINSHTPKDAKIALFGDTRGFYLDRPYFWADPGHNLKFTRDFDSADEFLAYLKRQGISYAMVNTCLIPRREDATGTAKHIHDLIDDGRLQVVYESSAVVLKVK
ncbi:MAG: ArnT family glycosyltransferase [Armatimonadota bacterium]